MPEKKPLFNSVSIAGTVAFFHTTRRTLENWVIDGCPRNDDKTFDLFQVHKWLLSRIEKKFNDENNVDVRKKEKEIEYKEAQIQKLKDNYIPREEHDEILSARAGSLRAFFEKSAMKNAIHYHGKTLDEIRAIRLREAQEAMEAYIGNVRR